MKVFAVNNGSKTDFELMDDMQAGGSNSHSGGAVVLAENIEEAQKLVDKAIVDAGGYNIEGRKVGTLTEISLDKAGIILFAIGDC